MRAIPTIATLALVLSLVAEPARADLFSHNGTNGSSPAGTGEVDVALYVINSVGLVQVGKTFNEIATHRLIYSFDGGSGMGSGSEPPVSWTETIVNKSGIAWSDFHMTLFGADFFSSNGDGSLANAMNSVQTTEGAGNILFGSDAGSIDHSMIVRDSDEHTASLWLFFDDPIGVGEAFSLSFFIEPVALFAKFELSEGPSPIPAPGAALLCMLGFGFVGWAKRRLA